MKISVTTFLDQLYDLQVRGAVIITLCQQKDSAFVGALLEWLVQSEGVLKNHHRSQLGEIAGVRAQLLAASQNVYDRRILNLPTPGSKKAYYAAAAILYNSAQNVLSQQIATFSDMREEAAKYMRQIVLISLQKDKLYPIWGAPLGISERLAALWASFTSDADLVQGARQVLISVNYADALRILDEVITDMKL